MVLPIVGPYPLRFINSAALSHISGSVQENCLVGGIRVAAERCGIAWPGVVGCDDVAGVLLINIPLNASRTPLIVRAKHGLYRG